MAHLFTTFFNVFAGYFMYNEASNRAQNAVGLLETDPPLRSSGNRACLQVGNQLVCSTYCYLTQ